VIILVRDDSATPKVWATNGLQRRWVKDAAEAVMWDAVNNAFWPGVTQPTWSTNPAASYPVVDANVFFRLPIVTNLS
jgi:hypothetical protein